MRDEMLVERALEMLDNGIKINPTYLMWKFRITNEYAADICQLAYIMFGIKWFRIRRGLETDIAKEAEDASLCRP